MKVDVTQVLMALDGTPLKDGSKEMSLGAALMMGLLRGEEKDTGDQKYTKARMAMRIQDNDEVDFPAEDVVLLKRTCAFLPPLFVLRIYDALDPPS